MRYFHWYYRDCRMPCCRPCQHFHSSACGDRPDTKITHAFNFILFHFSCKEKVTNSFIRPVLKTLVLSTSCSAIAWGVNLWIRDRAFFSVLLTVSLCIICTGQQCLWKYYPQYFSVEMCFVAVFFFCFFHNFDEKTHTGKILVFPKKGWSLWSLFRSLITSLTTELYRELV